MRNEENRTRDGKESRSEGASQGEPGGIEKAKEGVKAGASGVAELTRTVASETAEKAGRVKEFIRESEADADLQRGVERGAEQGLHKAGDRLSGAAPAIGRGAEAAAEKVGAALHAVARPLATVLGAIAGTVGGWWKTASESGFELPETEEKACRTHFAAVAGRPADMTFDRARTGYALGYVAARNPAYRDRGFDEVETDLRRGFAGEQAREYDALREFTRYGYERGVGGTA